jgi:peptidoglycan/xylan/chitin deacetylase (PgdA/CDA1 family)
MNKTANTSRYRWIAMSITIIIILATSACTGGAQSSSAEATALFESALLTATYAVNASSPQPTETALASATETPTQPTATNTPEPTATIDPNVTPPALPPIYVSSLLNPNDPPHTYIQDTCEYLYKRWNPNNSEPGTVVMPIMFHSILAAGKEVTKDYQITSETLTQLMDNLAAQGFEAITMQQLRDFLVDNAKIPARSVIFIVDDRHYADYFETHFLPYYEKYGWTVTNAWISSPDTLKDVYDGNIRLQNEGWVDHQAHGVVHNIPIGADSTEEFIRSELFGSSDTINEKYGKRPIAYIWPGGGFSPLAAQIAHEAGYELGFTTNPRGPLMFNWIPLTDSADPARPMWMPEGAVNDPLMVLPRYTDADSSYHIDTVRSIGKEAKEYARQNKDIELQYYNLMCKSSTGELPSANSAAGSEAEQ